MKLYVFGDSYAVHFPEDKWSWVEAVASNIKLPICALGHSGTSLEYVYKKFNDVKHSIEENDILIFCITSLDRRWFFPNRFDGTNPSLMQNSLYSEDEKQAVNYYFTFINNQEIFNLNFLNWVELLTHYKYKKCLFLPCFPDSEKLLLKNIKVNLKNIHIAQGNLVSICYNEGESKPDDKRRNHITRDNHFILANKVIDWINNEVPLVLDGFHTNIITKEVLQRKNWEIQNLV